MQMMGEDDHQWGCGAHCGISKKKQMLMNDDDDDYDDGHDGDHDSGLR